MKRRTFLGLVAAGAGAGSARAVQASATPLPLEEQFGMLVDTTECIGCRKCEFACNRENQATHAPVEAFEDDSAYTERRFPSAGSYTVVNRFPNPDAPDKPVYVKSQCMHCLHPACASACLVGALQRDADGVVKYDASKCMGCRYCMVACPFDVPAYEYDRPFAPRVTKCSFCFHRIEQEGGIPACAEICPPMCLTFGKRDELLTLARQKIASDPARYINRIYGEHEAGGTAWLYLAPRAFEELGFHKLDDKAPPALTEAIQHGIFKYGMLPAMAYALLGAAMHVFRPSDSDAGHGEGGAA